MFKSGEDQIAHAFSLLWKYIITSVDVILTNDKEKVDEIERNIDYFVAKKIDTFKDRLEKENMNLAA